MTKLITFALWGEDNKYCWGAVENARLAKQFYPGWTCRFYLSGQNANPDAPVGAMSNAIRHLIDMDNVEIVTVDEPADWTGMFWRFYPASETDVEVFIARDCDSRLSQREADAVQEWMEGPYLMHAMRDHPHHTTPILGGMWGAKRYACSEMKLWIEQWNKEDRWQTDQDFLRAKVWPACWHKILVHDDWGRFGMAQTKPFPTPRDGDDFVGSIIGPTGERLHPEHHAML